MKYVPSFNITLFLNKNSVPKLVYYFIFESLEIVEIKIHIYKYIYYSLDF